MKKKDTKTHSECGPSSLERVVNCTASVLHNRKAPEEKESDYSAEGTTAHDCYEAFNINCILGKKPTRIVREFLLKSYPAEMVAHSEKAYLYTKKLLEAQPKGALFFAEEEVDISHFTRKGHAGTLDAAIVSQFGLLTIIDYKYGAGVMVDAEENLQLIAYALAIAKKFDYNFTKVCMVVIQPRVEDENGNTVRSWSCSIDKLIKYENKIQLKVDEAYTKKAKFKYGDWCRFCRGRVNCPEISKVALKEAQVEFDDNKGLISVADPVLAKIPKLGIYLNAADKLEEWIKSVRKTAFFALQQGEKIEGWKLVHGRATRNWLNAEKTLKEAKKKFGPSLPLSTPELLSPAQLEKAIAEQFDKKFATGWVADRVSRVSTGYSMARADDKREEASTVEDDFGDTTKNKKKKGKLK